MTFELNTKVYFLKRAILLLIAVSLNFVLGYGQFLPHDSILNSQNRQIDTLSIQQSFSLRDSLLKVSERIFIWGEECEDILCDGMSETDYKESKDCSWIPLAKDSTKHKSTLIEFAKHIKYADFESIINNLAKSKICKAYYSSLLSADGRRLYVLEIGTGNENVVLTGGVHAREISNPQFLLKFASELINAYEKGNTEIISLLAKRKLVILPCVNPDGYTAVLEGIESIRNKQLFLANIDKKNIEQLKSNANGVDLNRNFPNYSACACWKGVKRTDMIKYQPDCFFFPGYRLGVENETKTTMNFLDKYIPNACIYVDLHSAGRVIYAGKPHLSDTFNVMAITFGKNIAKQTSYLLLGVEEEQTGLGADGTITDYAAEVAAGFQFNATTGRLMPPSWEKGCLIRNFNKTKQNVSILTVETLARRRKAKTLKLYPEELSTEWKKYNLSHTLNSLMSYTFESEKIKMTEKSVFEKKMLVP